MDLSDHTVTHILFTPLQLNTPDQNLYIYLKKPIIHLKNTKINGNEMFSIKNHTQYRINQVAIHTPNVLDAQAPWGIIDPHQHTLTLMDGTLKHARQKHQQTIEAKKIIYHWDQKNWCTVGPTLITNEQNISTHARNICSDKNQGAYTNKKIHINVPKTAETHQPS